MIDSGGFAGRIRPPVHNGFALSSPPKRKASHRPRNVRHLLSVLAVTALTGCSVHPIPDDVAYPIPTENIVSQARCELRDGLVEKVAIWPAPGSEDTELGVLMELEVGHGEA